MRGPALLLRAAGAARFALALGSLGNVRTKTLKAYTEGEFQEIVRSLP